MRMAGVVHPTPQTDRLLATEDIAHRLNVSTDGLGTTLPEGLPYAPGVGSGTANTIPNEFLDESCQERAADDRDGLRDAHVSNGATAGEEDDNVGFFRTFDLSFCEEGIVAPHPPSTNHGLVTSPVFASPAVCRICNWPPGVPFGNGQ
jgi:hypothetical protein